MTEEADGSFTLVGILRGGGLDCSELEDPDYNSENKTGKWMRVSSYRQTLLFRTNRVIRSSFKLWLIMIMIIIIIIIIIIDLK